jgi:hypothetical protein
MANKEGNSTDMEDLGGKMSDAPISSLAALEVLVSFFPIVVPFALPICSSSDPIPAWHVP